MERNSFWIFFGILLAFGIAMETLKDSVPQTKSGQRIATRYEDLEQAGMMADADARAGRIAGLARESTQSPARIRAVTLPTTPALTQSGATTAAQPKTANVKTADKKKKDDKKKKKKKKKKIDGKPDDPNSPSSDDEDAEDDGDSPTVGATDGGAAGGGMPTPSRQDNDIPQTQREWEDLVLREPDFKATEKFVKFYKSNLVSSEIFYNVVRQMLDDSRPKMRKLGLVALGATPSSRSFVELAVFVQDEPGVSPLKTQAQSYLYRYMELAYLRHLAGAMQAPDAPFANLESIRVLRMSMDRYLKVAMIRNPAELSNSSADGSTDMSSTGDQTSGTNSTPTTGTTTGTATGNATDTTNTVRKQAFDVTIYFRPFVTILERITATEDNREIKQAASNALNTLRGLLPTTQTLAQDSQSDTNGGDAAQPPATVGRDQGSNPTAGALVPSGAAAPRSWR
ncbi:MAG: hypothetical protein NDI61_08205 [Bdellovibrionaceae bacterium]|nr:hypothetical protein [Pseudobdellovibrionaceae bacterium]